MNSIKLSALEAIKSALMWWFQGLLAPWKVKLARPVVAALLAEDLFEAEWRAGEIVVDGSTPIARQSAPQRAFCLVPPQLLISHSLSSAQRGLLAQDVVEEALPFTRDEVWAVIDEAGDKLYCVARNDLLQHYVGIQGGFAGFAFATVRGWLFLRSPFSLGSTKAPVIERKSRNVIAWLFGLVLLIGLSTLWAMSNWRAEIEKQSELRQKIVALAPASTTELVNVVATLKSTESVQPDQYVSILRSIVGYLADDADIDQVIITQSELIIDAHASSASALQRNLSKSDLISNTEFVAAITTDTKTGRERFRLRSELVHSPSVYLGDGEK